MDIARKTLEELRESDKTGKSQPDIWFENIRHVPLEDNDMNQDREEVHLMTIDKQMTH